MALVPSHHARLINPVSSEIKNKTMKMKNKIFAMPAAAVAMRPRERHFTVLSWC